MRSNTERTKVPEFTELRTRQVRVFRLRTDVLEQFTLHLAAGEAPLVPAEAWGPYSLTKLARHDREIRWHFDVPVEACNAYFLIHDDRGHVVSKPLKAISRIEPDPTFTFEVVYTLRLD